MLAAWNQLRRFWRLGVNQEEFTTRGDLQISLIDN